MMMMACKFDNAYFVKSQNLSSAYFVEGGRSGCSQLCTCMSSGSYDIMWELSSLMSNLPLDE